MENAIRNWIETDLDAIVAAWLTALQDLARQDLELRQDPDRYLRGWLLERLKQPDAFGLVAETGCDLSGFLLGRIAIWESEPPILVPRSIGVIDVVYVAEPARRRGVGSQLVAEALAYAARRRVSAVETTYETGNLGAAGMWKKHGFRSWMENVYRPTKAPPRRVGF